MTELVAVLTPIVLVDALNPVLFAMLVFAAGSTKPVVNSTAMLLGHTLTYIVMGMVISIGLDTVTERLQNPERIDFVVQAIIGILLLWVTLKAKKEGPPEADEPEWDLTPMTCFGFGAIVNLIGIPFALPYFAAVSQIMQQDLSLAGAFTALCMYNLAYMAIFAVVPVAIAVAGDNAKPLLEKINRFLVGAAEIAMPWMIFLLGAALLVDAIMFFATGEGFL